MTLARCPSPNFGARRGGVRPSLVVLHYTAMDTAEAAIERLCDPAAEVSAHYLIDRCGAVTQMVEEAHRAWHAGAGHWAGQTDINSHSVGIELANSGAAPFALAQMRALEDLLAEVMDRLGIRPEGVIGHSDMAPGRKADPGARFDWRALSRRGLSVWPEAHERIAADKTRFLRDAARFGYPADAGLEMILAVFRLRFRPGAQGALDDNDMALMADLAQRYGPELTH